MPPLREPTFPAYMDIAVLFGHLMLLATQIAVAARLTNNTAVIVHIVLVWLHSMVHDVIKVVHWVIRGHYGLSRETVRAVVHTLQGVSLDEQVTSDVEEVMQG